MFFIESRSWEAPALFLCSRRNVLSLQINKNIIDFTSMKRAAVTLFCLLALCPFVKAGDSTLVSPDGRLAVKVSANAGMVKFSVQQDNKPILLPSQTNMQLASGQDLASLLQLAKASHGRSTVDLETPVYRKSKIHEVYNWLRLQGKGCGMEFRAFNNGIAYRFLTHFKDSLYVKDEINRFDFSGKPKLCYLPFENTGTDFQGFYSQTPLDSISSEAYLASQLVAAWPDGKRAFITDFNVRDYPVMFLRHQQGDLVSEYCQYPAKEKIYGKKMTRLRVTSTKDYIAR